MASRTRAGLKIFHRCWPKLTIRLRKSWGSRGLGSTLTTLHLFHAARAAEILGLPENIQQVAMLPVAYTVGTDFKPAVRPGPETITHWNAW